MKHIQQAGGIILNHNGEVVIVTNSNGSRSFPKGACEGDETPVETARREIREETGLAQVTFSAELGTVVRQGYTADNFDAPSVIKHTTIFACHTDEIDLKPEVDDIKAAAWVKPEDVAETLTYKEDAEFYDKYRHKLRAKLEP